MLIIHTETQNSCYLKTYYFWIVMFISSSVLDTYGHTSSKARGTKKAQEWTQARGMPSLQENVHMVSPWTEGSVVF